MGGGGIHVQLPYTVLTYSECGGSIAVLLPYNLCGYHATQCGYHTAPGWLSDSVWLPHNSWLDTRFCVTTIQLLCDYHATPMWCTIIPVW